MCLLDEMKLDEMRHHVQSAKDYREELLQNFSNPISETDCFESNNTENKSFFELYTSMEVLVRDKSLDIDVIDVLLLMRVLECTQRENGCCYSNAQFAHLMGIGATTISTRISKLHKIGLLLKYVRFNDTCLKFRKLKVDMPRLYELCEQATDNTAEATGVIMLKSSMFEHLPQEREFVE